MTGGRFVDVDVAGKRVEAASQVQLYGCGRHRTRRAAEGRHRFEDRFGRKNHEWGDGFLPFSRERPALSCRSSSATWAITEDQSPATGWRNRRAVGYQGL